MKVEWKRSTMHLFVLVCLGHWMSSLFLGLLAPLRWDDKQSSFDAVGRGQDCSPVSLILDPILKTRNNSRFRELPMLIHGCRTPHLQPCFWRTHLGQHSSNDECRTKQVIEFLELKLAWQIQMKTAWLSIKGTSSRKRSLWKLHF